MKKYIAFLRLILIANLILVCFFAYKGYVISKELHSLDHNQAMKEISVNQQGQKITKVSADLSKKVIPGGQTVGIYVKTKGVLVIDTSEIRNQENVIVEPAKDLLKCGDYILSVNGKKTNTKKQLIDSITNCNGKLLCFSILRDGDKQQVTIPPVQTGENEYKVGIWVRDDLQGLGTITYIKDDEYGALGHSISDIDIGKQLNVLKGEIYTANLFGVNKGKSGKPGEIEGLISYQVENVIGSIEKNSQYGIAGRLMKDYQMDDCDGVYVGSKKEVHTGKAYIQSYISGQKELYEIEIKNGILNSDDKKDMEIRVTDERLIQLTGGIVQGMSGSPIIQDGKLIGAVTHVFVDDPTRGYGIFIEEMMGE